VQVLDFNPQYAKNKKTSEAEMGGSHFMARPTNSSKDSIFPITRAKQTGGVAQAVEN
jgi:hypothetical protein